mgnify:CR=1 FL=1
MDLSSLNHWQQLAFCTALCERSFPNFQLFCEIEKLNDHEKQARKVLNKIWEFLRGQLTSSKNLEKQLEPLSELIPNPENYEHYGVYPAMDALVALQSCLQATIDSSVEDAQSIQKMVHERLKEVLELQDISWESSELWSRQMQFEASILHIIQAHNSHAHMIKELIPLSHDNGISQIGICLSD